MKTKCQECEFGSNTLSFRGSVYKFSLAIKKSRIIRYDKGECGCRRDEWNEKEEKCIKSNFSEFKQFLF